MGVLFFLVYKCWLVVFDDPYVGLLLLLLHVYWFFCRWSSIESINLAFLRRSIWDCPYMWICCSWSSSGALWFNGRFRRFFLCWTQTATEKFHCRQVSHLKIIGMNYLAKSVYQNLVYLCSFVYQPASLPLRSNFHSIAVALKIDRMFEDVMVADRKLKVFCPRCHHWVQFFHIFCCSKSRHGIWAWLRQDLLVPSMGDPAVTTEWFHTSPMVLLSNMGGPHWEMIGSVSDRFLSQQPSEPRLPAAYTWPWRMGSEKKDDMRLAWPKALDWQRSCGRHWKSSNDLQISTAFWYTSKTICE